MKRPIGRKATWRRARLCTTALASVLVMAPAAAGATTYSVTINDGTIYSFTVDNDTYDNIGTTLNNNPWWEDNTLANVIATASDATSGGEPVEFARSASNTGTSGIVVTTYNTASQVDLAASEQFEGSESANYAVFQSLSYVPEIDGAALAKGTFVLAALSLYTLGARRERPRGKRA
ncbi:hypothetical protein V6X63_10295 [Spiribacter sp. 221]|uniref:hypothetical protein n=1 Tax=Spiribacter onubensis TaxID=3122420 RepID=UPI00349F5E28